MRAQAQTILILIFLLGSCRLIAQSPQLLLHSKDGWDTPLNMKEMHVQTVFVSDRAYTTYRLKYANSTDSEGTGTFRFYLKAGLTPRRFAVKLTSGWREAEMVERTQDERAIQASLFFSELQLRQYLFEEEVFQIPPEGEYEVIFTYEEKLLTKENHYHYQLPIAVESPLDSFSVHLEGLLVEPVIEGNTYQMRFEEKQGLVGGRFQETAFKGYDPLVVKIPRKSAVERHVGRGKVTKDYYFYANISLPDSLARAKPQAVCLIWDQSHSAGQKQVEKELSFLNNYFSQLGEFELRLITFTTQVESDHTFKIKDGNWLAAKAIIRQLNYDGATNYGCLALPSIQTDLFIISTDGEFTIGQGSLPLSKTPVISILSSEVANAIAPWHWAKQTNGNVIELLKESTRERYHKLVNFPIQFLSASYDTSQIALVYPTEAQLLQPNFSFTGRLKTKKGAITLNFKLGEQTFSKKIVLRKNTHVYGHRIEDIWAHSEIKSLIKRTEKQPNSLYRKFIVGLSRIYKVPTPHTRLSLLETVDDYVSSGITPPNDLALAYRLYLKNLERQEEKESLRYGVLLDSIAQEYHTWYQRTFFTDYQLGELNSVYLQDIYRTYSSLKEQTLFKKEQLEELTIVPDAVGKPATKALTTLIFLPWDVARADMEALQLATDKERYPLYLSFKKKYLWMPGFYAEAAQVFWEKGNKELALRVLSNLLEIEQDNISWIRYISHSLLRMNLPAYAFPLLQKAFKARPHDPQSYRDLARCHTALGNNQQAVNLLAEALRRNWGSSYVGLKAILMSELNHLIITSEYPLAVDDIPEVIKEGKVLDLRIVVEWLGTHFPMDVWVIEPTHEKAYYGNKLTKIGGLFSDNKQNQYGIEQYIIKEAIEGQYDVKLDYAPPTGITLFPPAALVNIYKDYGSVHESNSQQYIQLPKEERLVAASSVIYQVGNVSTAARYNSIQLAQEVHDFSFYQQGKGIISMNVHEVALWDLPSEQHEVLFQELEEGEFVFKQLAVSPSQQYLVVWLDSLVQQPEASGEMIDEWGVNDYVPILKVFDLTEKQNLRTLLLPQSISFVGCLNGGDVIYATAEGLFQLSENESSAYLRWPFNHPVQKIVEQNGLIGISTTDELTIINATDWSLKATIPIKGIQSFSLNQDQFAYYANNELFIRHYQGSTKSIAWQKYDEESVIEQLLLSPDGKLLAIHPLTSNQVIVLDTKTGSRIISYFHTKTVKAIRFSADGSLLASASGANDIRVRNIKTLPSTAFKLSESKGVKFEVAAADGKVYIVKKKGISTLEVSADGSIEYSPEKLGENLSISPTYFKLLSSKKRKWMVYAYNNASGFTLGQITLKGRWNQKEQLLTDWMEKFDFSHTTQIAIPNKQNIIVFDKGKSLQVLSLNKLQAYQAGKDGDETTYFSEQCVHQLTNSHILNEFQTIAVSEDGKYIAANEKEHIYIWNADGKLLEIIEAPHASAMLKFGHKDRYLFFEGEDHTLMKWDWRTSKQVMAFQGHRNKLTGFAQHENGYILTASADHTIKLWNQSGQLLKTFFGKAPNQIAFYSENLFVSANEDAELKFWQWDGKQD